ncbi:MAG: PIG-L family deacetylase [Chloroflexi bacterium]|nr:PIG-L family deacetylase [Chloroflexota bacterium]
MVSVTVPPTCSNVRTIGAGGILAHSASEGVATYLLTATRGEMGWPGSDETHPGTHGLARIREAELRAAAQVLGVHEVEILDYVDGHLNQAPSAEVIAPTAGPPPYAVYAVTPTVAFGFGTDKTFSPTRWRFA